MQDEIIKLLKDEDDLEKTRKKRVEEKTMVKSATPANEDDTRK